MRDGGEDNIENSEAVKVGDGQPVEDGETTLVKDGETGNLGKGGH